MTITKKQLLDQLTVKQETVKLTSLKNAEVTIKELTIAETKQFNNILTDESKNNTEAMHYACKCAMIEPSFFTDEELQLLNKEADVVISEIYSLIPLIGKTEEEKKKYYELIEKLNKEEKEEASKEDLEKK